LPPIAARIRSGSGKSALLALLCGFDSPDAGWVRLNGEAIAGAPPWHTCAVLPQSLGLANELTIAETSRCRCGYGYGRVAGGRAVRRCSNASPHYSVNSE
jgi:ABC-type Fe3+/spermidine/putrescine transport system ATPase subunit